MAQSWGGLLAARAISGIGVSAAMAISAAVIVDVSFVHDRGRMIAAYTLAISNGVRYT